MYHKDMAIRQFTTNSISSLVIKVVLVAGLTVGGVLTINKMVHKKSSTNEKVLSAETAKKDQKQETTGEKNKAINQFVQDTKSTINDVLGETTKVLLDTASNSAQKAEDYLIQTAVDKVMDQLDKLPEKQQEEIKKEICK